MMATCLNYVFIDKNYSYLISKVSTYFGNSDHLLVNCLLNFNCEQRQSSNWWFNKSLFNNKILKKEVLEEIREPNSSNDWDLYKIYLQSIIRAFRKPKAPENKIAKLNNEITKLSERIASSINAENLFPDLDELSVQLQDELTAFAEK